MLFSVLIYDSEPLVERLGKEEERSRVERHVAFQEGAREGRQLGPVARLMPTSAAVTLKPAPAGAGRALVLDGPFAETKEQLVGFYVIDSDSLEEAIEKVRGLPLDSGSLEIRPISWYDPGVLG